MKKILTILIIISVPAFLMVNCNKNARVLNIDSLGELNQKVSALNAAKRAEYLKNLNGKKVIWTVKVIGYDNHGLKPYASKYVIGFSDPDRQIQPSTMSICYTDSRVKELKKGQTIKISGVLRFDKEVMNLYPPFDLYPCIRLE